MKRGKIKPEMVGKGLHDIVNTWSAIRCPTASNALEAEVQKCMRWQGPHVEGEHYHRGDLVQRSGTVWVAERQTIDRPGESRSWRMLVKTPTRTGGQP